MEWRAHRSLWLVLSAVLVAFLPALVAEFNWDDDHYVEANPLVRLESLETLGRVFTTGVVGNYHPLTILSLALDYRIGGLSPTIYHLTNVLLHLLNVVLVHRFVLRLSGRHDAAWVAALWFGIHPMRVESVVWISARKDLLYTAFYLGSLLAYDAHARGTRRFRALAASLVLFVLSLLSKGMAVSLPLVLPLIDYLRRRPMSRGLLMEKVPFLALALVFGWIAVRTQWGHGAGDQDLARSLGERLWLALVALCLYLWKLALPLDLSAVYPYPEYAGARYPAPWAVLSTVAAAIAAVAYAARRGREVVFGALFFLANVLLVLQVLPIGGALAADRYTYLASVGPAYLLGEACARLSTGRRRAAAVTVAVLAVAGLLAAASWHRSTVWKNRVTLFTDVLAKYPGFPPAWDVRGLERAARGDPSGALADFDRAIALNPEFSRAHVNRGNTRADLGDTRGALADYDRAIEIDPRSTLAHYNRGHLLGELGDVEGAIAEMTETIRLAPELREAWINRGDAYRWTGRYVLAIADYDRALELRPDDGAVHAFRADARARLGDREGAARDLERARLLGHPVGEGRARPDRQPSGP